MCAELLKQMSIKTRIGPTISALMSSLVGTHTAHIIYLTRADQDIIEIAIWPCAISKLKELIIF